MILFIPQRQSKPYKGVYIMNQSHDHPLGNNIVFHKLSLNPYDLDLTRHTPNFVQFGLGP